MLEDYVLVTKAAEELGMTRGALWKAIERGLVQTERVGPTHLIHRAELERFRVERRHRGWPKGKPRKQPPTA